jgi:tetratricopeptide (TPR) repeat protein
MEEAMKPTRNYPSNNVKSFLFVFLLIISVLLSYSTTKAQVDDGCASQLREAEEFYKAGEWDKAIELIQQCLAKNNVSESERGEAYKLLGLVYIATELEKEANSAFRNLLIMVPNYKIDPVNDPPQLKQMIEEISKTLKPTIVSIKPDSVSEGVAGFTMNLKGSDFVYGSVVRFNGVDKETIFLSSNELNAKIMTEDLAESGEYDIVVNIPLQEEDKLSNVKKFQVISSGSFPWTWVGIGAGAVVAAVLAIMLAPNGAGEEEPIADPPGRP